MAFKPRNEEYTSESGEKYTFQTVAPSQWANIQDRVTDKNGKLLNALLIPAMLDNVIVTPSGLKMDDFDEWADLEEVASAAFQFQQFRKRKVTEPTES